MISTETAPIRPKVNEGQGPTTTIPQRGRGDRDHRRHNQPATGSAGRRSARASAAPRRPSGRCGDVVSLPTFSARMVKLPGPLSVPPMTLAPGCPSTGSASPVTMLSSTALAPSSIMPLTGMLITRPHPQPIVRKHLVEGHFLVAAVRTQSAPGLGSQVQECLDGTTGRSRARSSSTWPRRPGL